MPTYEYECKVCGHTFDVFHNMTAKPRIKCEKCGGATKKLIGAGAGIIFKGSGFYETDYKKKSVSPSTRPTPRSSDNGSSESAKPSESKTESKSEKSSDT